MFLGYDRNSDICSLEMSNEQILLSCLFDIYVNKYTYPIVSHCGKTCIMLFTYILYY